MKFVTALIWAFRRLVTQGPLGVLLLILSLVPVLFIDWTSTYAARPDLNADRNKDAATTSSLPLFPVLETDFPPPTYTKVIKVGKKDTLTSILRREGISLITVSQIQKKLKNVFDPRSIKPGQEIVLQITPLSSRIKHNALERIVLRPDIYNEIIVEKAGKDNFDIRSQKVPIETRLTKSIGVIDGSLYKSAMRAGVPDQVIMRFIKIFSWDVDFQRGIRRGDKYQVMYEVLYTKAGKLARFGSIKYAGLNLQGRHRVLYRYKTSKGLIDFFDKKGFSARKPLMLTPIDGARLSSGYGKRRHPILGYTKMHRGLDFAAPLGTPIYSAGDGIIVERRRKGFYGKFIRVRHNSRFETAYAHLSSYKRGVVVGKRVRQGQVIGFVGSTGRSTGPHLHYEVRRNGKAVNPRRIKMPSGIKLKGRELRKYERARKEIINQYSALPEQNPFPVSEK